MCDLKTGRACIEPLTPPAYAELMDFNGLRRYNAA